MLECRGITKKYGRKTAVDDVSFRMMPGRVYAMLGPNGGGKTTLMKMAVGLTKPSRGEFLYKEEPISGQSRKEIAYMSTEPYFYSWMTVESVGKYYEDFFEDFSMERYQALLQRMQLTPDLKTKTLSSGMMAKLKIAVTMAREAKVYLLDEPLNGIDLLAREAIIKTISEAIRNDVILVVSSHLVDELEKITDEALYIKEGHLAAMWGKDDLYRQQGKTLVDLYREIYGNGGEQPWQN